MAPELLVPSQKVALSSEQQARLRQYRRLWIAGDDLGEAASIIQDALGRTFRRRRDNRPSPLQIALTTAIVVSYARPFVKSRGDSTTADRTVPGKLLRVLSTSEQKLHASILEARNREIAHSDAEVLQLTLELFPSGDGAISFATREPLTREDLRKLSRMITKLSEEIENRCDELRRSLPHNVWL